ncbi:uncharacterized protein LOC144477580 isoform X2 [Augochlora pura]
MMHFIFRSYTFSLFFDMDGFQKNYTTYYNVMCITGLWPGDHSLITKVQRFVFCLLTLGCIGIQVSTLALIEISLYNLLQVLSFTFPMLLFFLRYVGFIANFPVKSVFDCLERDYVATKDPIEVDIFMKQVVGARRAIMALVALAIAGVFTMTVMILVPTVFQSNLQTHYLRFFGFLYNERSRQTDWVSCQLVTVVSLGLFAIACTESSLAVFAAYFCGLLEIARFVAVQLFHMLAAILPEF